MDFSPGCGQLQGVSWSSRGADWLFKPAGCSCLFLIGLGLSESRPSSNLLLPQLHWQDRVIEEPMVMTCVLLFMMMMVGVFAESHPFD